MHTRFLIVWCLLTLVGTITALYLYYRKPPTEETAPEKINKDSYRFTYDTGRDGALMVLVPAGDFIMGATEDNGSKYDETPSHKVYLDAFWIDRYEVTNRMYKQFIDQTGHRIPYVNAEWAQPYNWEKGSYPSGREDYPVVLISWGDAASYAAWAGKRLPTEAEWEKAARGGLVKKRYPWGDQITNRHANYFTSITTENRMKPVGSYSPNPFGIYDMSGNVWEWCADWYGKTYYKKSPKKNPQGPASGNYRVYRGGAWINRGEQLRCSERARNAPVHQSHIIGFRCAK
jgi:formylglycine-generating enzyme required for sulfatase activity